MNFFLKNLKKSYWNKKFLDCFEHEIKNKNIAKKEKNINNEKIITFDKKIKEKNKKIEIKENVIKKIKKFFQENPDKYFTSYKIKVLTKLYKEDLTYLLDFLVQNGFLLKVKRKAKNYRIYDYYILNPNKKKQEKEYQQKIINKIKKFFLNDSGNYYTKTKIEAKTQIYSRNIKKILEDLVKEKFLVKRELLAGNNHYHIHYALNPNISKIKNLFLNDDKNLKLTAIEIAKATKMDINKVNEVLNILEKDNFLKKDRMPSLLRDLYYLNPNRLNNNYRKEEEIVNV